MARSTALDAKQIRFCEEYCVDFNGTRAAISAGYSKRSAHDTANRLLKKTEIQEHIGEIKHETEKRLGISRDRVARELARIAFSDVTSFFNDDGDFKKFSELTEDQRAVLSSLEVEELFEGKGADKVKVGLLRKIKVWDKKAALDSLAKMFGYNEPDKVTGEINLNGAKITFK